MLKMLMLMSPLRWLITPPVVFIKPLLISRFPGWLAYWQHAGAAALPGYL